MVPSARLHAATRIRLSTADKSTPAGISIGIFCRARRGMGGLSLLRGTPRTPSSFARERGSHPLAARARAFITILCRSRDGERDEGGRKGCLSQRTGNRLWKIMGHRVAEGLAKRFYPAFKRGQQMPWHVRSTDASRRAAPASNSCDTTRKFAFPSPKMIAELYYRITLWKGPSREVKLKGRYATLFI